MPNPPLYDRVREWTATAGTGDVALAGAITQFVAFGAAVDDGAEVAYAVVHRTADEWETGVATYAAGTNTLTRTTVMASTNGGAVVNFSAGIKDVFSTLPAGLLAAVARTGAYADLTGRPDLSVYATTSAVAAGYQPLDADLTKIAALTGAGVPTRNSGTGNWVLNGLFTSFVSNVPGVTFNMGSPSAAGTRSANITLNTPADLLAAVLPDQSGSPGYYLGTDGSTASWQNPFASPTLTGTPTAPTADPGTSTAQIATTAFVSTNFSQIGHTHAYSTLTGLPDLSVYATTSAVAAGYQPLDATLSALAALTIAANSLTVGTGADAFSQTTFAANTFPARASSGNLVAKTITDFGLSLADDTDAATARTTLGLGTLATQSGTFSGTSSGTNTGDQFTGETANTLIGRRLASSGAAEELALSGFSEATTGVFRPRGPLTNTTANGATTIALATSNRHVLTLTASATLTLTGDSDGDSFALWVRGQASGYTITWWSGVKWVGGAAPTIPTTSGHVTAVVFTRLASGEYWASAAAEAY
jgi:hypothetical protein